MSLRRALLLTTAILTAACGSASNTSDSGTPGDDAQDVAVASTDGDPGADAGPDVVSVDATPPVDPNARLATSATITDVALFQGTRVGLFSQGAVVARRNAPVVASRAALVRVYVGTSAGFSPRELTAQLVISRPGAPDFVLRDTRRISGASREDTAASVFALSVPAAQVTPDARFAVALLDPDGAAPAGSAANEARAPRDGSSAALGALSDAGGLNLVLVPLRYDSDGSGRLPDTSEAQLERYRALLTALYPLQTARITVHAAVPYSGRLTLSGNVNFGAVNQLLIDLRGTDNAAPDAYYYALVAPAADFDTYCGRSCVTGQSYVVDTAADADIRVGSGVGWTGEDSAWTLAHEVGHEHGREHAPCSTSGSDPGYPYAGGGIGVWGYDPRDGTFFSPSTTTDFMGYCDVQWTSDYTWSAIFARVREVNGAGARVQPGTSGADAVRPGVALRFLRLGAAGDAAWERAVRLSGVPSGARYALRWLDGAGRALGDGEAVRVRESESADVLLLVPTAPAGARSVQVRGAGAATSVTQIALP